MNIFNEGLFLTHRDHRGLRAMISLSANSQVIALSYEQRALCVFR